MKPIIKATDVANVTRNVMGSFCFRVLTQTQQQDGVLSLTTDSPQQKNKKTKTEMEGSMFILSPVTCQSACFGVWESIKSTTIGSRERTQSNAEASAGS